VALLSETHLKHHERFFIYNYHVYRKDHFPNLKGGTAVAVRYGIPHAHVDQPPLQSTEAKGISVLIGTARSYLQLFTNLQVNPGVMKTPFIK